MPIGVAIVESQVEFAR
jgi:hypothetical protein